MKIVAKTMVDAMITMKEHSNEQAPEVGLDRLDSAAHGDENSKAAWQADIGSPPYPRVGGLNPARPSVRALRLVTYSWTRETTVAWLQVSGETETGALL